MAKQPYIDYDVRDPAQNLEKYLQMNGKRVFLNAVRRMTTSITSTLAETGLGWDDIDWFVPHQANLRINQKVAEMAQVPWEKVLNSIQHYGNTTAATVPLTIDHWRKQGRVKSGAVILSPVFGSGYTWGSAVFRL
jgi:3-oxoacyl-[acyl-carrier-protein] synthase-3